MFPKIGDRIFAADPEGRDGAEPPDTSQPEAPEEFTDAKHESLFSLETNFLQEESGDDCPLKTSQGQDIVCVVWIHQLLSMGVGG